MLHLCIEACFYHFYSIIYRAFLIVVSVLFMLATLTDCVCLCSGHLLEEHGEPVLAGQRALSGRGHLPLQYP